MILLSLAENTLWHCCLPNTPVTIFLMQKILLFLIIYNVLVIISYFLLEKYLESILVGIATLRSIIYYIFSKKGLKPNIYILLFFEFLIITVSIVIWQNWFDIFMLTSVIVTTYSSWQDNVAVIKISAMVTSVLFILFDVFSMAYVYIISEVLYGLTALISLIKTNNNKSKKEL